MQSRPTLLLLPLAAALLSACASLAPSYERPAAPVPATWPDTAPSTATSAPSAAELPWRDFVRDERLRQVIASALANSRDLRQAAARIESARATYRIQDAETLPTLTAGISGSRARSFNSSSGDSAVSKSVSASVGLSAYELDLFGKTRSLTEAALQSYFATEQGARATRISLIGETVSAWLTLASDRSQLALAQQTLQSSEQSLALTRKRREAGVATRIDERQAETIYQQARADVASQSTAVAQDRNALELLVGQRVDDAWLPDALPDNAEILAEVQAGLSSSVLLQRPDVLQAEHQLRSANADIGAARAAFFPSISLTASGGVASGALSSLFKSGAPTIWSLAPSVSLPIFDNGANQASLAYAQSQRELYLAAYEQAVQTGFKEVADALARRGTMREQLAAQIALTEAARDSERLAELRYRSGVDTYLASLDAQRTRYSAEQSLISTRLTELDNRITLYRVLGGGLAAQP
jgi:outer membrane protein, multidrug efflux system